LSNGAKAFGSSGVGSDKGSDDAATNADLREQVRQLKASLELANADAEAFRQQWQDLRLRDQALGVDALTADEKRLQDRVVEAVKELYHTEQERLGAVNRLQQLLDAGSAFLKDAKVDPQKRADYEVALRGARDFLGALGKPDVPIAASLEQGQIVHVNGELNSVILNVGTGVGAKVGMPFRVFREDRLIGRVKAFQVRDQVCAALVESVESGKQFRVGDRVAVAADK